MAEVHAPWEMIITDMASLRGQVNKYRSARAGHHERRSVGGV